MAQIRHQHIEWPGDQIVVRRTPHTEVDAWASLQETRIPPDRLVVTNTLAALLLVPLPTRGLTVRGRWIGVPGSKLWHPRFWLPPHIQYRYRMSDGSPEPDERWALRVGLELTGNGLYDAQSGTWLDVIATATGWDVTEDTEAAALAEFWMFGMDVPAVDLVEKAVAGMFDDADDPDWAVQVASDLLPGVLQDSWAEQAKSLNLGCVLITESAKDEAEPLQPLVERVLDVAKQGRTVFSGLAAERDWWVRLPSAIRGRAGVPRRVISDVLPAIAERLNEIEERFRFSGSSRPVG